MIENTEFKEEPSTHQLIKNRNLNYFISVKYLIKYKTMNHILLDTFSLESELLLSFFFLFIQYHLFLLFVLILYKIKKYI